MEVKTLEIFGKLKFGSDVDTFIALCKDKKREWILANTTQRNETAISDFINNPAISKDCKCLDCGKNKDNGNKRSGVSTEVTTSIEPVNDSRDGTGDSIERPKTVKKRKNK